MPETPAAVPAPLETAYRYFYLDYKNGGYFYKTAEAGLFTGILEISHLHADTSALPETPAAVPAPLETIYRYFYMDYKNGGYFYKTAEAGLFTGIGVKY